MPTPATTRLMQAAHDGRLPDQQPVRTRTNLNGVLPGARRTAGVSPVAAAAALEIANERVRRANREARRLQDLLDDTASELEETRRLFQSFARLVYADTEGRRPHGASVLQRDAVKLAMQLTQESAASTGRKADAGLTVERMEAETAARHTEVVAIAQAFAASAAASKEK